MSWGPSKEWLDSLKPGDEVAIQRGHWGGPEFAKVTRRTPKYIGMCTGRNGGTAYPCPCFHSCGGSDG